MGMIENHYYYYYPNESFTLSVEILDMPEVAISFTVEGEDADKLISALKQEHQGTLKEMCDTAFCHDMRNFEAFCKERGIQYHDTCEIVV